MTSHQHMENSSKKRKNIGEKHNLKSELRGKTETSGAFDKRMRKITITAGRKSQKKKVRKNRRGIGEKKTMGKAEP